MMSRTFVNAAPVRWAGLFPICLLLCVTHTSSQSRTVANIIGVTSEELPTARAVLRHLQAESLFELEAIPTTSTGLELDRLMEIEQQIQASNYYAIVGKYNRLIAMVTEKLRVPYLCDWVHEDRKYMYGILPHPVELWSALQDVLSKFQWTPVGLLYDDTEGAGIIKRFLVDSGLDMRIWKLESNTPTDQEIRALLLRMRDHEVTNFLLLTPPELIRRIFMQGRRLGLISKSYSWIVSNLLSDDISSGILDDIKVNITALTMAQSEDVEPLSDIVDSIHSAAIYDAISLLVETRTTMTNELLSTSEDVATIISEIDFQGVTGRIQFNDRRYRTRYSLSVMQHQFTEFVKIGEWQSTVEGRSLSIPSNGRPRNLTASASVQGRKGLRVVTILEKPFTMLKDDYQLFQGNARYEGFAVELMTKIAEVLDFEFELYIVPDGKFGSKNKDGTWNGMIGQVMQGNATMSMAPLSINAERESAIDFTKPFKTRGISVLMKTPQFQASYFQFLKPLSSKVWLCIAVGILTISIILFAIEKFNPPMEAAQTGTQNVLESCWFVFGSLVQGGTDICPSSLAGRILSCIWWLFALLMVSSYTANLAAFLTVKKIQPPISTTTDLAEQTKIQFGTVRNSGVEGFFKNTGIAAFREMWNMMDEVFPDAMVNTTQEGLDKVKEGQYAFLWDSTVTSYYAAVDCDFTEIGPPVDPKGFGVGVVSGAPYREELALAILTLSDAGFINELENKYWGTSVCPDFSKSSTGETTELQLENVAGIFFVLLGGVIFALFVCVIARLVSQSQMRKKAKGNSYMDGYVLPDVNQDHGAKL